VSTLALVFIMDTIAQGTNVDSLANVLRKHIANDTVKVNLLNNILEKQAFELEQQKIDAIQESKERLQTIVVTTLIFGFILLFSLSAVAYRSFKAKHRLNDVLTKRNREIDELNEEYLALNEELSQSNEQLYHAKGIIEERENLLTQITDNVPVFISLINNDLKYEFANKGYAKTFNRKSKDDLPGKTVKEILAADTYERAIPNLIKALDGETVSFENTLQTRDERQQTLQTTYTPYYFHDGIQGVLVCSVDITERKKAEQVLKASEEKLQLVIKNSNDIFVLVNEKGEQYFISDVANGLTGFSVEELSGHIENVIHPEDVEIVKQHWNRVISNKNTPDTIQYRHKHKEKSYVWFEAVAQNFLDHPSIQSVVANIRDITERKQTERALREMEEEKKRLMEREMERINSELETNQKSMTAATLKLIQNAGRDTQTIERLMNIEKDTNPEGKRAISILISQYKRQSYNSNWEEFEILFEKVHSSFYENLSARYPDLTANERKMCAFLKLNMSNKDIAQITFQSDDALKKARLRLRQKLGIDREINLAAFMQSL
jgi:PAS domain S-box-containing protein